MTNHMTIPGTYVSPEIVRVETNLSIEAFNDYVASNSSVVIGASRRGSSIWLLKTGCTTAECSVR